jgi:hypothetical protein
MQCRGHQGWLVIVAHLSWSSTKLINGRADGACMRYVSSHSYILCDCCIYWLFLNSFAMADTDAAGQTITASFDEHEVASENFNSRLHTTTLTTLIYSSLKPQTSTYMYIYESKRLRLCTTLALCLSPLSHHTDYYSVPVRQMTPNSQSTNCYIIYTLSSYVVTPYVRLHITTCTYS